jgi:hypothetical protein
VRPDGYGEGKSAMRCKECGKRREDACFVEGACNECARSAANAWLAMSPVQRKFSSLPDEKLESLMEFATKAARWLWCKRAGEASSLPVDHPEAGG